MTDQAAFLRAILANPDDDLPRLVLADFLDERGECDLAEFIRLQCELARRDLLLPPLASMPSHLCTTCNALWILWPDDKGWSLCSVACGKCCDNEPMTGPNIRQITLEELDLLRRERQLYDTLPEWNKKSEGFDILFRRGFIHTLRGPLSAFWVERECNCCKGVGGLGTLAGRMGCMKCAPNHTTRGTGRVSGPTPALVEICGREPVTEIVVTDHQPERLAYNLWQWAHEGNRGNDPTGQESSMLPESLFLAIEGHYCADPDTWSRWKRYPSADDARRALSGAILKAARGKSFTHAT